MREVQGGGGMSAATFLFRGQVFTAENGVRYAIVQVDNERPCVLNAGDAAVLATKWANDYGDESEPARTMTRIAAAMNGNGEVQ